MQSETKNDLSSIVNGVLSKSNDEEITSYLRKGEVENNGDFNSKPRRIDVLRVEIAKLVNKSKKENLIDTEGNLLITVLSKFSEKTLQDLKLMEIATIDTGKSRLKKDLVKIIEL